MKLFKSIYLFLFVSLFWFWLGQPTTVLSPSSRSISPDKNDHRLQCVSFTPLKGSETPYDLGKSVQLTSARLEEDVSLLSKNFSCVRIYSPLGMEELPALLKKYDMKLMLGLWINSDDQENQLEIQRAVSLATRVPEVVSAIIVGNEALLRKEVTGEQMVGYLKQVKALLPQWPVTYADVWEFWVQYPELASVADFLTIHILPYWENDPTPVSKTKDYLESVVSKVEHHFPDKKVFIGETGWPSFGRQREGARPGVGQQVTFLKLFVELADQKKWNYNLIEAFDQPWKRNNEGAVGGYWGIYDQYRHDKGFISGQVTRLPKWKWHLTLSSLLLAGLLIFCRPRQDLPFYLWVRREIIVALGLICIPWQVGEYYFSVRNFYEALDALLVLMLAIFSFFFLASSSIFCVQNQQIHSLKNQTVIDFFTSQRRQQLFLFFSILFLLSLLKMQLGFVFDARYRMFPVAGYLVPVISFCLLRNYLPKTHLTYVLAGNAGLFFVISSLVIFFNETLFNSESNLWVLMMLSLGLCLMQWGLALDAHSALRKISDRLFNLWPVLMVILFSAVVAYIVRYQLMESVRLVELCQPQKLSLWCEVRDKIGMGIYFQFMAKLGFVFGLINLVWKRFTLMLWLCIFMTVQGLVLYQMDWAWKGAALALFLCSRPISLTTASQKYDQVC